MPANIISLEASDGSQVEFYDEIIGVGQMKNVYFTTCGENAVAFYKEPLSPAALDRIEMITTIYKDRIFNNAHGSYWKNILVWPTKLVKHGDKTGFVLPRFKAPFLFEYGSIKNDFLNIKGKEKEGKWFASASNQNSYLAKEEKGDWLGYLRICLMIARGVRRLHAAGLAHSDLSYKNILVSPLGGHASIVDIDGLVVPGKYPPDVIGTADFIAPEVVSTSHLPKDDPNRFLPTISTDRHALAVLIYHYLLLRHPLRGDKVYDMDPHTDEKLSMGEKALFIEHPSDSTNRIDPTKVRDKDLPWKDTKKLPYSLTGPYLKELFERAFINGLHDPKKRPTADEWENAIIKSLDLIQPCINEKCEQGWFIFDNTNKPKCPFCNTSYQGALPVINLYSERTKGNYVTDNHRLMVYNNQSLFPWHINRLIQPNERIEKQHTRRMGYFVNHKKKWYLVNENIPKLENVKTKKIYPIGSKVILKDNMQLLTGQEKGDRLLHIQLIKS